MYTSRYIYICLLNTYSTCQWLCHLFPHHHWSLGSSDTKECSHWRQKRFTSTVLWLPVSCHDAEGTNSWSTFQISFFKQIEVMNFSQKWKSLSRSIWKRKYICYLQATQIHEQESLSVKWWCASLSILHLSCPGDPGDSQISTGKKNPPSAILPTSALEASGLPWLRQALRQLLTSRIPWFSREIDTSQSATTLQLWTSMKQ